MGDTLLGEKGSEPMESVEEVKRKSKGKGSRFGNRYGFELKLRCVKLRLEESVGGHEKDTRSGISGSSGIGESTTIITGMKLFD